MHRRGHIGIGLLVYAPVAYFLVSDELLTTFGLGLVGIWFWSWAPDIDMVLPIPHRGPTHSFVAAVIAGVLTAMVAVDLASHGVGATHYAPIEWDASAVYAARFGFGIGALGVIGHLLGDVITPMGIRPWWPVSGQTHSVVLTLSANGAVNTALLLLGSVALAAALVFSSFA